MSDSQIFVMLAFRTAGAEAQVGGAQLAPGTGTGAKIRAGPRNTSATDHVDKYCFNYA